MEDPWANAWGETSKSSVPEPSPLSAGSSTWAAPSVSALHGDNEDDLSTSSWSVQPTTHWNEPDISETSLWNNDVSSAWNPTPSTFDRISLSKDSASESETQFSTTSSEGPQQQSLSSSPSPSFTRDEDSPPPSPRVKLPDTPPDTPPRPLVPPALSLDTPEDIDAFGTFETADEVVESEEWSPSKPNFSLPSSDAAVWGASWDEPNSATTDATNDTSHELDDAWEKARQQKEKQDRHVPPELLASVLQRFEKLSSDLWPDSGSSTTTPYRHERSMDMEDLGLHSVALKLIPEDLTLPPNVPFSKTFTSKQLVEALRLTRHSPLTRLSPMAFYMSSKGLTSWEASIKAMPNITSDDFTPAGWKIVESAQGEAQVTEDVKKKPSGGGLLSFFGRRATTSSPDSPSGRRSASPVNVPASSVKAVSSPRPSSDSAKTNSAQSQITGQVAPVSPTASTFTSASSKTNHKKAMSLSDNPVASAAIDSDPIKRETTPPPSAVSRFLGRFSSRPRSSSSHDPLSLSADDLEFLSDVPTVETKEDKIMELDALSVMLKSPPLPTPLPPPLKPPPKAPPRPSRTASTANNRSDPHDDFFSYLDHDPSQSVQPILPLTVVPTPPVKSTSAHISTSSTASTSSQHFSDPAPTLGTLDPPSQPSQGHSDQSWPSFDYPSTPMNKTTQPKRQIVAIMASSSSATSSTPPPLLPKPGSSFAIPPPPPSNNRTNSSSTGNSTGFGSIVSPLPPPPSSRAHTPLRPFSQGQPPLAQPALIDDDDDFADFLSSPAQATNPSQLSFGDFAPPVAASTNVMSINNAPTPNNTLDEFDDFISPLPPQPPAKPLNFSANSFAPPSQTSQDTPPQEQAAIPRKASRAADHSRTLSLLETAAARGRWLAPPSPLPEALPPPSNGQSSEMDFLDSGSSMQAQQARAAATLAASSASVTSNGSSGWTFPPPLNSSSFDSNSNTRSSVPALNNKPQPLIQPSVMQSTPALSAGTKTGGLSAQDLSFFEGL